jgi:hypothetical protein
VAQEVPEGTRGAGTQVSEGHTQGVLVFGW